MLKSQNNNSHRLCKITLSFLINVKQSKLKLLKRTPIYTEK